jgi:HEAT repeat protein
MQDCKKIVAALQGGGDASDIREAAWQAGESVCQEAVPALAGLLASGNLGIQEAADQALRRIGGKATVEAVIPLLRSDEAPVRNLAMDILRAVGAQDLPSLVGLLRDEDADIRIFASDILGSTGSVAAVGPLGEALLRDPEVNVRYQAAVSLGELGLKDAARYLNKALGDEEWVQFSVIEALAKIRDDSSIGALAKALHKSSDLVASMIVEALGEMGNVKAVTMLMKHLDAASTALRNKICKAIVQILGGKSLKLLSEAERERFGQYLLVALTDEDEAVQDAAMTGLGFVGGEKASADVLALAAALDPDRDHDRLVLAVEALAGMGPTRPLEQALEADAVRPVQVVVEVAQRLCSPALCEAMKAAFWSRDRDLQREIVQALCACARADDKPFFLEVLERHEDGTVLKAALEYLGAQGGQDVGDLLFGFLEHPYDDVKEAALEACVHVGSRAMDERFRAMFAEEDPVRRLMAVYAMGKLGVAGHADEIRAALGDAVPDIRKVALEAFGDSCVDIGQWLPVIRERLHDEHREVRLTVVELLGHCEGEELLPCLEEALDDEDDWVRVRAVEALGRRGADAAVPRLVEIATGTNTLLAIKAVEALGAIGGKTAFRALLELLGAEDQELQAAAEDAVARIQESGEGEL